MQECAPLDSIAILEAAFLRMMKRADAGIAMNAEVRIYNYLQALSIYVSARIQITRAKRHEDFDSRKLWEREATRRQAIKNEALSLLNEAGITDQQIRNQYLIPI